ncbi:MAG: hypothetical protein OEM91_16275 [Hyphomicrobiales bacterium]|nr:hypothetical protein [Hyphomicrobiales bacterium]
MKYVEIYSDENGVSHFQDLNIEFTSGVVAPPALPVGLSEFHAATEVGFISIPSGWVGGWHQPPTEGYILVLAGEVEIEVGDGEIRRFPAGSVWLHKDRSGPGHNSSVVSSEDAKLVMVKFPDK